MTRFFLGVDVGNSKSHAVVADESGLVLGFAAAGPGSWEAIGWDGSRALLRELTGEALAAAGVKREQIAAAGYGLAGYDWPEDRQPYVEVIRSLGLGGPFELVNDALIGLFVGAAAGWGVCVSAGTSCNCYGRNEVGAIGRVAGFSHRFAEYAGAGEIVHRAVQAVGRAWSRRGPRTQLSQTFIALTGASDLTDLLAGLVRGRYALTARDAPVVFEVAAQGDEVAQAIIRWAGQGLGDLAVGVIRQLGLETREFDVVLSGSVYRQNLSLMEMTRETIVAVAPGARLVRLAAPPVLGAVLLGMEQLGLETARAREGLLKWVQDNDLEN